MSAKVWNPDIMLSQKRAMDACLANHRGLRRAPA